jgi:hypothetical protein
MVMKNTTHYLLLSTAWLAMAACTQPDPLPEATQGGKQTFGCRVNGKAFVPDGGTGWNATKPIVLYNSDRRADDGSIVRILYIEATSRTGESIVVVITEPYETGIRLINKTFTPLSWSPIPGNQALYSGAGGSFVTGPNHPGLITLTRADTVARILSGTFEFKAMNPKTGEVVEVTDGRFDVRM